MKKVLIAVICCLMIFATACGTISSEKTVQQNNEQFHSDQIKTDDKLENDNNIRAYTTSFKNNGLLFVIIDIDNNTITRFTSLSSVIDTEYFKGTLEDGFTCFGMEYSLNLSNDNEVLTEKHTIGKKRPVYKLNRTSMELVQPYLDKLENWYDIYDNRIEGQSVQFGSYKHSIDKEPQPIEWIILKSENGKTLLLSNYIFNFMQFRNAYSQAWMICPWGESEIREWLNELFYKEAFNDDEKEKIQSTSILIDGQTTNDKIFLLSVDEVNGYLISSYKMSTGTLLANDACNRRDKEMQNWWLITPSTDAKKYYVDKDGNVKDEYTDKCFGIRPALWVDSSIIEE